MPAHNTPDISTAFTAIRARVASFDRERRQLAGSLRDIISSAQLLLGELGQESSGFTWGRRGPGRRRGSAAKSAAGQGRRRKPKISAEGRRRIAEAQRARWARHKAAQNKK